MNSYTFDNQRFVEVRKHLKFSQKAFGDKLGIKQGSISDIERGKVVNLSNQLKISLAQIFNINIDYLYNISEEMFLNSEKDSNSIINSGEKQNKKTLQLSKEYDLNDASIISDSTVDILSNKNGNTYYIYEDNSIEIEVTFFPFSAYASYVEAYFDESFIEKEFSTTRFKVDHVGKGFYLGFKTANESMNGGGLNDTPGGAEILGREIGRHLWDSFRHEKYGYILMTKKNIFHKDIIDYNKDTGKLLLHSRNPEEKDFEIDINDVYRIFNVIKRSF
ncbi:hypothetical protein AS589_09195 [Empedobacter brevis]|uniref:helix-turn-helix domain-containing protein n=1 Tax=Empedobacter brevis TaxID=247 RepID=UPI00131FD42C|nr:helix-turn-helix transcriptional regulator [Empedobacter brevis]QHC84931.1 hypothetical protein AS589_09195 [Empedobacter brevis]